MLTQCCIIRYDVHGTLVCRVLSPETPACIPETVRGSTQSFYMRRGDHSGEAVGFAVLERCYPRRYTATTSQLIISITSSTAGSERLATSCSERRRLDQWPLRS